MAAKMQPKLVSKEMIKPSSSSTPNIHKLSFFDHISPPIYVPLILFYKTTHGETDYQNMSNILKTSLSDTLSRYYPLAGRVKDDVTVDCNNEGALFLKAAMECSLSEFLRNPDDGNMSVLLPDRRWSKDSPLTSFVAVQVTQFCCGGISLGLCFYHKVLDMASMSSFMNDWASIARNSGREIGVEFNIGSFYRPVDLSTLKLPMSHSDSRTYVSRRVVFDGANTEKLKAMVADQVPNPTRVEVITALLYKSAICSTAKANSSGSLKPGIMSHVMNLRTHVSPRLSERNKGNIFGMFSVSTKEDQEVELGWLVKEFRKSKTRLSDSCATSDPEELCLLLLNNVKDIFSFSDVENEVYTCTSWCRFPFYETDFGWGKPVWVGRVFRKAKNMMALMDTKEGNGIEVLINLDTKTMAEFERDRELLPFCCINPSVLDP